MRRTSAQTFGEIEIIQELLTFLFLSPDDLRRDFRQMAEVLPDDIPGCLIVADPLGNDILCTLNGLIGTVYFLLRIDEPFSLEHEVVATLTHDEVCQRFKALLTSRFSTSFPAWLERCIDILEFRLIPALLDPSLQFIGKFSLFLDG